MPKQFPLARILLWIPQMHWYRIIWGFSAQTASASGKVSDGLLHCILIVLAPAYARSEADIQGAAVEVLSFFERKAAHMFLYFLLVILLLAALAPFVRNILRRSAAAGVFCAVLAALDEIHQTYVPGRSRVWYLVPTAMGWSRAKRPAPAVCNPNMDARRDWPSQCLYSAAPYTIRLQPSGFCAPLSAGPGKLGTA